MHGFHLLSVRQVQQITAKNCENQDWLRTSCFAAGIDKFLQDEFHYPD